MISEVCKVEFVLSVTHMCFLKVLHCLYYNDVIVFLRT